MGAYLLCFLIELQFLDVPLFLFSIFTGCQLYHNFMKNALLFTLTLFYIFNSYFRSSKYYCMLHMETDAFTNINSYITIKPTHFLQCHSSTSLCIRYLLSSGTCCTNLSHAFRLYLRSHLLKKIALVLIQCKSHLRVHSKRKSTRKRRDVFKKTQFVLKKSK